MDELILKNEAGRLITNAHALKEQLPVLLKKYNYVVTDENVADAKKDRANLNKLVKEMSSRRIQYEKDTFSDWEKAKKELMDTEKEIKAAAKRMGDEINSLDIRRQREMHDWCRNAWDALNTGIRFEAVAVSKWWEAKTYTKDKVRKLMADIAIGFAKDWELIELRSKTMGMTDHNLEILHGAFLKDPEQDLNGFVQMLLKTQEIREQCKEPEPVVEEPVNELPEIEFDDEGEIMEWHKVEIL
ncbi:DUF1351 domain-containing protein, partial [Faecalibaculum rodentium]